MAKSLLRDIYYDVKHPASFGSVDKLYRAVQEKDNKISRADVEKFLSGEIAYTLHRRIVRKFPRNPVIANHYRDLAQADLIDVQKYSKDNDGINWILTIIDVFTKQAFAVPIKRKTAREIATAFEKVFANYRPGNLQTDEGTEFTNVLVQNLFKELLINYYLAKNERIKCAVIERFQRTLMSKIHKYFTSKGTHRFVDVLDDMMFSYNNTIHRSISMTPIQAIHADPKIIFKKLYGVGSFRDLLKQRAKRASKKEGDSVRIPAQKGTFAKGYTQNFTDEVYTVTNVNRSYRKPVYTLKTHRGDAIQGNFYPEEVQKIENEDRYRVVVLGERKRGRGKQYLIRWENFPDLEPEWIPASRLESLS